VSARFAAAAIALAALAICPAPLFAQAPKAPEKIDIRVRPIDAFQPAEPDRKIFGSLEFRGGLELSSPSKSFGGLSAIRVAPDGASFLAVTDKADWLRGRIAYRDNRPAGIVDAEMVPILGPDGRAITARGWYDTEALALDGNAAYVALERVHRILRFDYGKDGLLARGQIVPTPPEMSRLPSNRGIECLIAMPKGTPLAGALMAISERSLDSDGNVRGFLIGGPKPGTFTVKRKDDFDIVDCALTPSADLLLLERFFTWQKGVAMRIRRVPLAAVVPDALLDGPSLIRADMGYQIDNMEGLSVHRAADGTIVLTLVSDDNFSIIQRTLLLQFALLDK
jgi:hypothetical protein